MPRSRPIYKLSLLNLRLNQLMQRPSAWLGGQAGLEKVQTAKAKDKVKVKMVLAPVEPAEVQAKLPKTKIKLAPGHPELPETQAKSLKAKVKLALTLTEPVKIQTKLL